MIGKLSKNGLNQQKFRRVSYRFYCQFSKILPKATKLSLFWCFLPENSTRDSWLESLMCIGLSTYIFFKRKIIILKGSLKIAFFARKSVLKTSTGNTEYENFNITTFYCYVKMN